MPCTGFEPAPVPKGPGAGLRALVVYTGRIMPEERNLGGRPTKLTPALGKAIAVLIRRGMSYQKAALAAGISEPTFHRWRKRGSEGEEPYVEFYELCEEANAQLQQDLLDRMLHIAEGHSEQRPLTRVVHQERIQQDGSIKVEKRTEYVGMDFKAVAWLLEHKWPQEFANRTRHEGTVGFNHGGKVGVEQAKPFEVLIVDPAEQPEDKQ